MSKILFYGFVYPLSFLPLRLLYCFSTVFYFILRTILPYRKKVVMDNLAKSFPFKNQSEIKAIKNKFYKHFADLIVEGIKNLSISERELRKRVQIENPEIMKQLFDENKSVLLVSGHYNNWEFLITAQQFLFPHQAVGIGKPLSNGFWDEKLNALRARFGMRIIHAKNVREKLKEWKSENCAILTLSDQSPGDSLKSYWTTFLNQPTPVLFGAEILANEHNYAVVFFEIKKVGRGIYRIYLDPITKNPLEMKYGEITEIHTKKLENMIQTNPQYWLWSHKRWKREVPVDLSLLRSHQEEKFNQKFR